MSTRGLMRDLLHRVRARIRGGVTERALRRAMWQSPRRVQQGLVHLLPQPGQFDPQDVRHVVVGGVRLDLFPHEFIQWVHYFGWLDPNFESLSCLSQDSRCLIDVGANVGIYSLRTAARAPGCEVTAVEAHPRTFARLAANTQLNPLLRVRPVNLAVASLPGTLKLFAFAGDDSGFTSAVARPEAQAVETIEVDAVTLDQLVAQRGLEPDLLKIDVEGFEPDVLAGGEQTLSRLRPDLVLEWTPTWTRGREATVSRAVGLLEQCGYRAWRVPSLEDPAAVDHPLESLRSGQGEQANLVLSTSAAMPARLEAHFREVAAR